MVKRKAGLIVEVVEQPGIGYHGQFFFDLMESSLKRFSYGLAVELAPHNVVALSVTPGFMRTEAILEGYGVTEANWRDAIDHPQAKGFGWAGSETPCFLGRGVAALAADPTIHKKSGGLFGSWALADEYGFTDIDGGRPHWGRYGKEHFPQFSTPNRRPLTNGGWWRRPASDRCARGDESIRRVTAPRQISLYSASMNGYRSRAAG